MGNKIMISIIIPVYNSQKEIGRCIESILHQTCNDFEVILINDGSTDDSFDICNYYALKDDRIRLYSQENKGAAAARNAGIKKAKGEFIKFVDSDDELPEDCLEKLIGRGISDMIISGFVMKWNDKSISYLPPSQKLNSQSDIIEFMSKLNIILCGSCCTKLYRKSIIEENDIYFPEDTKDVGEDHIFNWRYIVKCNSLISISEICYYYIENKNSLTHFNGDKKLNVDNHLKLMQHLSQMAAGIKEYNNGFSFFMYHDYFMDMIIRRLYMSDIHTKERRDYLVRFKNILKGQRYNTIRASSGLFTQCLTALSLIPSLKLSDLLLCFIFKIRKLL